MKKTIIYVSGMALGLLLLTGCDRIGGMVDEAQQRLAGFDEQESHDSTRDARGEADAELADGDGDGDGEEKHAEPTEEPAKEEKSLVEKARELGEMRARMKAGATNPGVFDELLAEAGLTKEELEASLFEIAEDPEASAAYLGTN